MITSRRLLRPAVAALLVATAGVRPARAQVAAPPAARAGVDTGAIAGARYRVEIPARWNGGLVMYAHGLRDLHALPIDWADPSARTFRDTLLARGFAFAESEYRRQGWAIAEGLEDIDALRQDFASRHGRPRETYVVGHSMGGLLAVLTLERHPGAYAGGLPLCGVLTPAPVLARLVEGLAAAEVVVPGLFRDGAAGLAGPMARGLTERAIADALALAPAARARLAAWMEVREVDVPRVLLFGRQTLDDLRVRAGGMPVGNADVVYAGWGDDAAVNRRVRRYAPDSAATAWLLERAWPTGALGAPALAVHTTYDELVPERAPNEYRLLAAHAGARGRFVQSWVEADGHCNIAPRQVGAAFDQLVAWARGGPRPAGGEIR